LNGFAPSPQLEASGLALLEDRARNFLEARRLDGRLRELTPYQLDEMHLDLTRNDYLGLRVDPVFQRKAATAINGLPAGGGASRLLGGEHPIFGQLEAAFARFKGSPSALYFSSGYAANQALAVTLSRFGARIFSDRLIHASTIDGIRLSGLPRSERVIYPHGDLDVLEKALRQSPAEYNLIFTESIFSMDGDESDLTGLMALADQYRGILVVDEAHAVGCCGPDGRGLAVAAELDLNRVIVIDTCGKALGVQGAVVHAPLWLRELLLNLARPFIYSTAPSPWLAAALRVSLQHVAKLEDRRRWLARSSRLLRDHLTELGFEVPCGRSHIIPVICGDDERALQLATALTERGIRVMAARPPTVPEGTARLRLSLHTALRDRGLEKICRAFVEVRDLAGVHYRG
jgi:8-amino-7-oxononanoate synthase